MRGESALSFVTARRTDPRKVMQTKSANLQSNFDYPRENPGRMGKVAMGYPDTNLEMFLASMYLESPLEKAPAALVIGWQGRRVFAISPACRRRRRIAHSRRTLFQPYSFLPFT
jgi:hypothetical protein